jgi:hypothetical protein
VSKTLSRSDHAVMLDNCHSYRCHFVYRYKCLLSVGRALTEVYYTFTNYAWKMLSLAFASDTFGSDSHKVLQVLESAFQPLHS